MFIYITYDTDGFITAYQNTEADGFTKVFILDSWINQFAQYPDKFRYDSTNQKLLNPGNLPSVSLNQVSTDVTTLQTQLQSLQSTGTQTDSQLGALVSNISVVQGQILGELQNIQTQLNASEKATTVPAANTTNSPA
ncbi:hypothetical protein [Lentilactobacillus kefiri]|uniref:hypothetical protein n=1 Tax=Lentilactobacillus kefiri TaxID=33962 RepID=UPI00345F1134